MRLIEPKRYAGIEPCLSRQNPFGRLLLILWRLSFAILIRGCRRREMVQDHYLAGKLEEFVLGGEMSGGDQVFTSPVKPPTQSVVRTQPAMMWAHR